MTSLSEITKECSNCHIEKPISSYRFKKGGKYLKHSFCQPCEAAKQKARREAAKAKDYEAYHIKLQERELRLKYGLSLKDYYDMWDKQEGVCAICSENCSKNLAVDHDHQTGKVRGLLCQKCNRGLGLFNDKPELLGKAKKYLENYK